MPSICAGDRLALQRLQDAAEKGQDLTLKSDTDAMSNLPFKITAYQKWDRST